MIFWCTTQRPHFIIISDRHRHIELLSDIAKKADGCTMDARFGTGVLGQDVNIRL